MRRVKAKMMPVNLGSYDHYIYALIVIFGTFLAVVGVLWLSQRSSYAPLVKSYRGIAQNFMSVISVLFALNVAFLANDTWKAHDEALGAVFLEAGHLQNIRDLGARLPEPSRAQVQEAATAYARLAVSDEWSKLAHRVSSDSASKALDDLLAAIAESAEPAAAGVQSLLLQQAIQVRSTRDVRVALSQTHVNPLKWLGMIFLGFLTMLSIAMVHVDQPRAQFLSVMLFAAAAAPTAAIILVHGNPFQEPAAVSPAPIAAFLDAVAATGTPSTPGH
jgi:hypothetical protein